MKALRRIIDTLTGNLSSGRLFRRAPLITFRAESRICPQCGVKTKVLKTTTRKVATLDIGDFMAREILYTCRRCGSVFRSEELRSLVADGCVIAYDVLVSVGQAFFLNSRTNEQIMLELRQRNVTVCKSEVSYLAKKFIIYLAAVHRKVQSKTRAFLSINGGYILHLDGTCEGESPHLMSVLDGITEIVLDNAKLPTENADDLIPFLQKVEKDYGEPVAAVSDMSKAILSALGVVFPHVPQFICHFHFLKDVGNDLFGEEYEIIRRRLKQHGIQATLRKTIRAVAKSVAVNRQDRREAFIESLQNDSALGVDAAAESLPQMTVQTLLLWALSGKKQGQGCGFPFDHPHLVFYHRLLTVDALLRKYSEAGLFTSNKAKKLYASVSRELLVVIRDVSLKKAVEAMQRKVAVFARLRAAMRLTLPENKRGLNDGSQPADIKVIENAVSNFRDHLCKNDRLMKDKGYRKMIEQIEKYWSMLFCDPIVVETKAGRILIQPQRTNNLIERFFRALLRIHRKKNGFGAMCRVLVAMLADTPLVMNLRNKAFMEILLDGKENLAECFADIDAAAVRQELNKLKLGEDLGCAAIRKVIGMPTFLKSLTDLVLRQAA